MRLPITIRWTADVEREQVEKERQDQVKRKRLILLTARLIKQRTVLQRWGLDEGVYGRGEPKTPRGAGVNL